MAGDASQNDKRDRAPDGPELCAPSHFRASGPLTPREGTRRLKSTTKHALVPFMDRSVTRWQAARPLALQLRKGSSFA